MRIRLALGLLLTLATLATLPATAAPTPPPDLSLRRYLSHTDFIPRAAQGGMSNPPIVFQNQGTPLGVSFTVNCSTGMTCSFVNGVMTMTAAGGGGFPRLDQVLDPTADKTFADGAHLIDFDFTTGNLTLGRTHTPGSAVLYVGNPASIFGGTSLANVISVNEGPFFDSGLGVRVIDDGGAATGGFTGFTTLINDTHLDTAGVLGNLYGIDINVNSTTHTLAITTDAVVAHFGNITGSPVNAYGVFVENQTAGSNNWSIKTGLGKVEFGDNTSAPSYSTATNCSSAASPATCGSAAAGSVAVPTGITPTLVVNTTAVTANSQILFTPDESLGAKLGVTCNSTIAQVAIEPIVTARTAATSFTIQYNTTITTNPICLSYLIIN